MKQVKEPPKEVKQKYLELQLIQRQVQQVQQQTQALEAQAGEMDVVLQALDEFSMAKPGSDSFVTLTPGLFVKAKLEQTDAVLLNVGGGAVVQKSIPDAKKIVASQTVELRKLQQELAEQLQKLAERAEKLQEELRKLIT
jgi:prefoldin alpha subunit